jgi:hypothetical protein
VGFQLAVFFYAPVQFIMGLVLLSFVVGEAFVVGIGLTALVMILSTLLSKKIGKLNKKILEAKDERMKLTN